jgi:hypothetical protein
MIDTAALAEHAQHELQTTGVLSAGTCRAYELLPEGARAAYTPALSFLGCPQQAVSEETDVVTSESDRVLASRLMLVKLGLGGGDPRWSSAVLDRLLDGVMQSPSGSVGDLIQALHDLLGDSRVVLSQPVANLIRELVVRCFTGFPASYNAVNWRGFVEKFPGGATKAQLYLAANAVPPTFMSTRLADAIEE